MFKHAGSQVHTSSSDILRCTRNTLQRTLSMKIMSLLPSRIQFTLSGRSLCKTDFVPPLLNQRTAWSIWSWKPPHWSDRGKVKSPKNVKPCWECRLISKLINNYYRPQRSCGQGNIFHLFVILFTRGGGIPEGTEADPPPGSRHALTPRSRPPWSRHPPWEQTPPHPGKQTPAYGRPVGILLECILVTKSLCWLQILNLWISSDNIPFMESNASCTI